MFNYGVGGNEVKRETSEGMADIPMNRTLFVQKLTNDPAIKPEIVQGLKTPEEVFAHYKPNVEVEFDNAEGAPVNETLHFNGLGDFAAKNITAQSNFLKQLNIEQDQYQKIIKQIKTNKLLKTALENADNKAAFADALRAMIQELEENK